MDKTAVNETAVNEKAINKTVVNKMAADKTAMNKMAADKMVINDTAVDKTVINETAADKTTSTEHINGTRFEQHSQAINIQTSHCCYTIAQSYQTPCNLVGPTVRMKVAMGEDTSDHQVIRKEIVEYALVVMSFLVHADLRNFRGKHKDENDSPGGVTCMVSYGDLHPTDHPGYFIINDLGVAICLKDFVVICFCGLRWHGGFPHTAQPGEEPKPWSYHFVVVCYPPHAMLDDSTVLSLGALPGGHHLYMPPEFIDATATGYNCTEPETQFYYHGLCQLAHHLGHQIPRSTMTIDFKKLAKCIMLKDDEDNVHYPQPWELHPGSTTTSVKFSCTHAEAVEKWEQHKNVQRQYIPHCVHLHQDHIEVEQEKKKKRKIFQGRNTKGSAKKKSKTSTVKVPDSHPKVQAQCVEDKGEDADGEDSYPEGSTSSTRLPAKVTEPSGEGRRAFIVPYVEIQMVPKGRKVQHSAPSSQYGTSSEDDDPAASHDESLGALVIHPIPIPGNLPSMPPFYKVLQLFSYENLSQALRTYCMFAAKPERNGNTFLEAEGNINLVIQAFWSNCFSHYFLAMLAGLWSAHSVISQKANAFELQLAFYRHRVMLSSAAAWYWLTQYCAARCVKIVDLCTQGVVDKDSPDWLEQQVKCIKASTPPKGSQKFLGFPWDSMN
ncbi:hypothetical protein L226DRAFT_527648 [Lentinus tigrinus ALCF2SS1-7]|uniref:uncharacterized protein n=1 Tax=Lentinus tigrinus ALCF2SS1-7 TaxID=1328758 RepID=UPI001165FE70|nr:hypothetical protein L226DRAFT_527648 [Lentinus tigrinus ALCF2SS1-7]